MSIKQKISAGIMSLHPVVLILIYVVAALVWILINEQLLGTFTIAAKQNQTAYIFAYLVLVALTAWTIYAVLKILRNRHPVEVRKHGRSHPTFKSRLPILIGLLLTLILLAPALNYAALHFFTPKVESDTYDELHTIAKLKSVQLDRWLIFRKGDVEVLAEDDDFAIKIDKLIKTNDVQVQQKIAKRLDSILVNYSLENIKVLDLELHTLLARGMRVLDIDENVIALAERAKESLRVQRTDFYVDRNGRVQLDILAPIKRTEGASSTVIGYVLVRTGPVRHMIPRLLAWPTVSKSAEANMVRHLAGMEEIIKTDSSEEPKSYLVRQPIEKSTTLYSQYTKNQLGTDYLGRTVYVSQANVPDSSWRIVAQIEQSEALAPLKSLLAWATWITLAVTASMSLLLIMLWNQQRKNYQLQITQADLEYDSLLKRFFDLPFIGMAITDPNSKHWLRVNQHLCKMFGYSEQELLGMTWPEMTVPEDLAPDLTLFNQLLDGKIDNYRIEKSFFHKNGSKVLTRLDITGVRNAQNIVQEILVVIEDVTEQRRAAHTLRLQEEFSRALLENQGDAVVACDAEMQLVVFNRMAREWHGLDPRKIPAAEWSNYYGLYDGTGERALEIDEIPLVRAYRGEYLSHEPMTIKATGQPPRYLSCSAVPFYSDQKVLLGAVAIMHDVTATKQTEEKLRMSAAVFEHTREGIMVTDASSRIVSVNRAFSDITLFEADEVIGKTPRMLASDRHGADYFRKLWASLESVGYWQGEIWNRRKNGEIFPSLMSISVIKNDEGEILNHVGVFADISTIKASEEKLEFLAHHDPLTELPNRLMLISRLNHAIEVAKREKSSIGLLVLDLDHFKNVNDSFGHLAGDELLQLVSERLKTRLRGVDTISRLGGDEFTILMEDLTQYEDAARVGESIIAEIEKPWRLSNNIEVRISASIGISIYPEHGNNSFDLLQHADAALYQAKANGRGCVQYFSESLTKAARDRFEIEARLRRALINQELCVYYQPKVDINSGKIIGAEALVRWQDPEKGMIMPDQFISIAEDTGLINQIGEFVLGEACRQTRAWLDQGIEMTIAVNLSAHQLYHSDIEETLCKVLKKTKLPPECIELELTESTLMLREAEIIRVLEGLRKKGVRLAIDDFGTGYSSLAYLKSFPLDTLKIDRSFVDDIEGDEDDRAITATIIGIAHTLGLKVVAEGVETDAQLAFLKKHKCDYYQGYLMSKPLPAGAFEAFIQSTNS